jgi:putative intracellular protease/amidase
MHDERARRQSAVWGPGTTDARLATTPVRRPASPTPAMNILIVTTSAWILPPDRPTGLWLEEFAAPYEHFAQAGADIVVASPDGGPVPLDPKTEPSDRQRVKWHRALMALGNTQALDEVPEDAASRFDGLFIPGGHGPLVDLVHHPVLQRLIAEFDDEGKFIGAVCHGPAALLNVRSASSGHYLVRDRRLTGFSNLEERLAGMHGKVPFLLEDELKRRGARYESALIPMTAHVIRDGNLVTGQNPASSEKVAEEFLDGLRRNVELFDALGLRNGRAPGARAVSEAWPGY